MNLVTTNKSLSPEFAVGDKSELVKLKMFFNKISDSDRVNHMLWNEKFRKPFSLVSWINIGLKVPASFRFEVIITQVNVENKCLREDSFRAGNQDLIEKDSNFRWIFELKMSIDSKYINPLQVVSRLTMGSLSSEDNPKMSKICCWFGMNWNKDVKVLEVKLLISC